MNWILQLHVSNPTAQAIAIIAGVCVLGMSLGAIRYRGIKLGTSGVLFAGLFAGHFYEPIDHHTLEFIKEFGLILFVFCLGLQLGPGFFDSLRRSGLQLNLLALAIVVLGAGLATGLGWLFGQDEPAILGIFSGATTNTPSLGAAQQALSSFPDVSQDRAALPALAYAVTYPVGIVGIISTLLVLRRIYRIDVAAELRDFHSSATESLDKVERRTLVVENRNLDGLPIGEVPGLVESGVVISRVRHAGETDTITATGQAILHVGDQLHTVGSARGLDRFQRVIGRSSEENLLSEDGPVKRQRIVATSKNVAGTTIRELQLEPLHGVVVTTVTRGSVEMIALPDLRLRLGDVLQVVGPEQGLNAAAAELGNKVEALNETHFVPLFAGIGVGILLGTFPIPCPGLPQPLKIGLAGGPLIIAILVGRLGRIGRLVWHMPQNANLAIRELGLALFFAAVGLLAGPTFFSAAFSLLGLIWLLVGACVTVIPLMAVGILSRHVLKMNYVTISGLLAGSMTDPPALAFANNLCESESPAVSYAAVYPLTMLLRIMTAQALAVLLCG